MCRKPRVFGGLGAVCTASAVPGSALIVASPGRPASTAPTRTAAIFAFIAGAVGNHEHAALGACRRAFMLIAWRGAGAGIHPARWHRHGHIPGWEPCTGDDGS